MFCVMEGLPEGVVGIEAVGTISGDDYDTTLVPAVEEAAAEHDKVALLLMFGPEFQGYSAGAALDDVRFGFSNFTSFRRIAIVSDNEWLRNGAAAMTYFVPGKSKGFSVGDLAAARAWIAEDD